MAHIGGQSRDQLVLFPTTLNEAVSSDHLVRVIDAFVDSLDLARQLRVGALAPRRPSQVLIEGLTWCAWQDANPRPAA